MLKKEKKGDKGEDFGNLIKLSKWWKTRNVW